MLPYRSTDTHFPQEVKTSNSVCLKANTIKFVFILCELYTYHSTNNFKFSLCYVEKFWTFTTHSTKLLYFTANLKKNLFFDPRFVYHLKKIL